MKASSTAPAQALHRMSAFGLSAAGVAVYFILTAALLAGLVWQLNRVFVADVMETLSAEMRTLTAIENTAEPGAMERTVAGIARQTNKRLYFLSASDGRKLAGNLAEFPPELAAGGAGGLFTYAFEKGPQAGERNAAGISVSLAGGGKLVVARDIEDQRRFVASIRLLALAAFALIAIGGLGLGILASRTALRRVESISDATRRIMAGEFSGRLPLQGSGDEFDRLSNSVNEMLVRIEDLMHGLKEVSDNIAHDLKTPLNRLRQRAEASLRSAGTADELRAGLGDTIEAADEIIKTFNALLLIARLEAGAVEETKTAIALAPVLADAAELYEPVAEEAGIRLFMGEICNVTLSANRHLIGQAVVNLIDNAIKYGRQSEPETTSGRARRDDRESRIELSLCLEHGRAIITVADNGPGISASDRKRAMERFVRLDKSRSLPGTGLGLSLVAAVARLHGGELRLEDNEPGLRAVLILPV